MHFGFCLLLAGDLRMPEHQERFATPPLSADGRPQRRNVFTKQCTRVGWGGGGVERARAARGSIVEEQV